MEDKIKFLKEELVLADNKYKALYESSPDMYVSVNPNNTKIMDCNNTLVLKTGYTKGNIIGKSIFFMYHQDCIEKVEQAFQSFVELGRVENTELLLKRKDGSKLPVLLRVEPVKNARGEIIYSNSCWRDISDIKQMQNALNRSYNKQKKTDNQLIKLDSKNKVLQDILSDASKNIIKSLKVIKTSSETLNTTSSESEYSKTMKAIEQQMDSILKGINSRNKTT